MIDLGTGNNNKINWIIEDKQEMIDIVETVYRGARKGRGLVVSPKDYSTKYRYWSFLLFVVLSPYLMFFLFVFFWCKQVTTGNKSIIIFTSSVKQDSFVLRGLNRVVLSRLCLEVDLFFKGLFLWNECETVCLRLHIFLLNKHGFLHLKVFAKCFMLMTPKDLLQISQFWKLDFPTISVIRSYKAKYWR